MRPQTTGSTVSLGRLGIDLAFRLNVRSEKPDSFINYKKQ